MSEKKLTALCEAVNRLQIALLDMGIDPATSINVTNDAGMALRAIGWGPQVSFNVKNLPREGYVNHICGVPFFIEPPKVDPRDSLPPYYSNQGN